MYQSICTNNRAHNVNRVWQASKTSNSHLATLPGSTTDLPALRASVQIFQVKKQSQTAAVPGGRARFPLMTATAHVVKQTTQLPQIISNMHHRSQHVSKYWRYSSTLAASPRSNITQLLLHQRLPPIMLPYYGSITEPSVIFTRQHILPLRTEAPPTN